jgi:hypothetical protein
MKVLEKSILVNFIDIVFEPCNSHVVQGVKKSDSRKFELDNDCVGGYGTYRVNTSSSFLLYFAKENGFNSKIDVLPFLKKSFSVSKIMKKKKNAILNTRPAQLVLIETVTEDNIFYKIKEEDKMNIKWINEIKNLL